MIKGSEKEEYAPGILQRRKLIGWKAFRS